MIWNKNIAIGRITHELLSTILSQQEKPSLYTRLALYWPSVVGQELAHYTFPKRLLPQGVLYIDVQRAGSLMVTYKAQEVLDQVNRYLGYKAFQRVVFRQVTTPSAPLLTESLDPPPAIAVEDIQNRYPEIQAVPRQVLRDALVRLGQALEQAAAARIGLNK